MSAPFKDATNDAVQFLTKHGDLTRAAAYDAIRLLTGNGFVVARTDMIPSATNLSQAAVAAALEAAGMICKRWHDKALIRADNNPDDDTHGATACTAASLDREIRALITQRDHDALAAHVAAEVAKARAEDARLTYKDRLEYRDTIKRLVVLAAKQGLTAVEAAELNKIEEHNEWDGLSCSRGGGWLVGHLSGCPYGYDQIGAKP